MARAMGLACKGLDEGGCPIGPAGMILQFGIPRVAIGEAMNGSGPETINFLRSHGVEMTLLGPNPALRSQA